MDGREQAAIILSQLGGSRALSMLLGAHTFVCGLIDNKDPYLSFKFKAASKVNFIRISLNWKDYYDIELAKTHGLTYTVVATFNDIDEDNLIDILENATDLSFRMPRLKQA
jgi:hypothetical protein